MTVININEYKERKQAEENDGKLETLLSEVLEACEHEDEGEKMDRAYSFMKSLIKKYSAK